MPAGGRLRKRGTAEFKPFILDTSHFRVLPTTATDLAFWSLPGRTPGSWLITVTLVSDCSELPAEIGPSTLDPCAWRHSWTYRVTPSGSLSLLFDEGDPDRAADVPPFVGEEWALEAIGTSRVGEVGATLAFAADGTVSGFGGCNDFGGPFTSDGSSLSVGPLAVTSKACEPDVMEVETAFLQTLQAASEWWASGAMMKIGSLDPLSELANVTLTLRPRGSGG